MTRKIVVGVTLLSTLSLYGGGHIAPPPKAAPVAPIVEEVPVVPAAVPAATSVSVLDTVPFYLGLGAIVAMVDRDPCPCNPDGDNIEDHRYGMMMKAGWDYNQYVGLEARYLKTLESDSFSETTHYGIYVKPQYPLTPQFNVYGLLGYGQTKVEMDNGILKCKLDEGSFSYGAGMAYNFYDPSTEKEGWGVWLDYQSLLNDEGIYHLDSDIVSLGVHYNF
jgi:OOP family OmpA-OmpF porin